MTTFLNLDEVQPEIKKTIRLGGKTHEMRPISVRKFIKNIREAKKLDQVEDIDRVTEIMMDMICEVFPTLDKDTLESLNMQQLEAIMDFVRAVPDEIKEQEGNA